MGKASTQIFFTMDSDGVNGKGGSRLCNAASHGVEQQEDLGPPAPDTKQEKAQNPPHTRRVGRACGAVTIRPARAAQSRGMVENEWTLVLGIDETISVCIDASWVGLVVLFNAVSIDIFFAI